MSAVNTKYIFRFQSRVYKSVSFDVSFDDLIATRREIIYGHTWGLDQQKYFFERSHCKFRREIGLIGTQIPKTEKNPKKSKKREKI